MMRLTKLHPLTSGLYFASVLMLSMFVQNPFVHVVSFLGAFAFYAKNSKSGVVKELLIYAAMLLIIAAVNPFFSHKGETALFFINKNPVTLESILYGFGMALMIIAVIYWFKCFNCIMSEDKLLCIFGGISPKLALLLSMSLRFLPLLNSQAKRIKDSQKAMGMYSSDAYIDRVKNTMRAYSSLVGWALENAIDVGTSMKSRGYGLKGRTHFSLFKFGLNDFLFVVLTVTFDALIISALINGGFDFEYYPHITTAKVDTITITAFFAFATMCFVPVVLELKEELQWKYYKSKI